MGTILRKQPEQDNTRHGTQDNAIKPAEMLE
jgi:hypothetical protein